MPPNFKQADILLKQAQEFLFWLKNAGGTMCMGFRLLLPDGLPAIDFSFQTKIIIYAFGHGHWGLSLAAGTAELVANVAKSARPAFYSDPFTGLRF